MTTLATRPEHIAAGEATEEEPESAAVHGCETTRQDQIATVSMIMRHVPEGHVRDEILDTLFADGDTRRKRAAEARTRTKTATAPVKPPVRKPTTPPMVPIGPARDYIADLTSRGMRQQAIARASGASEAAVSMLVRGAYKKGEPRRETITADLEARILAVEFVAPEVRQPKPPAPRKSRATRQATGGAA